MRRWFFSFILLLCPLLSWADPDAMNQVLRQKPVLENFKICHAGGCEAVETTGLSNDEWETIADLFQVAPETAEDERGLISLAIGLFETYVGVKTNTANDLGGTFSGFMVPGQLDCNDEAINSTTYMKLLTQAGFLKFHHVIDTKRRGYFLNRWPHSTAAIEDNATGEQFAVDSWFYDNGSPAVIIPLEQWKNGWKPSDGPSL